jgi:hypothetical protein
MVFPAHDAVTPAGNPVGAPIPVAPVVVCSHILTHNAVIAVLTHNVGLDEAAVTVLLEHRLVCVIAVTHTQCWT